MSYKQVKSFDQNTAGKLVGFCLQNVRKGYGIASKYPNAITAWSKTQQHADRNFPSGVAVPLFYTYKTDGHINVHLADGRVWSDGNLYPSLAAYESSHPAVHFLGWAEGVNDVRVVEFVSDPAPAGLLPQSYVGKRAYLSASVESWRVYKPGTHNVAGILKPKANGGLDYLIRGIDTLPGRVLVNSAAFGRPVSLPIDKDATVK